VESKGRSSWYVLHLYYRMPGPEAGCSVGIVNSSTYRLTVCCDSTKPD